jgi:hypothetical protein
MVDCAIGQAGEEQLCGPGSQLLAATVQRFHVETASELAGIKRDARRAINPLLSLCKRLPDFVRITANAITLRRSAPLPLNALLHDPLAPRRSHWNWRNHKPQRVRAGRPQRGLCAVAALLQPRLNGWGNLAISAAHPLGQSQSQPSSKVHCNYGDHPYLDTVYLQHAKLELPVYKGR